MLDIDARSWRCLEWDRLKQFLASESRSKYGRELCLVLVPAEDRDQVIAGLDTTNEASAILSSQPSFFLDSTPDIRGTMKTLAAGGSVLPEELLEIRETLSIARRIKSSLQLLSPDSFPSMVEYLPRINPQEDLRRELERCLDESGNIKDEASSHLAQLRRSVRKLHNDIREQLHRLINSTTISKALQEPIFTQRGGRYCLPVDASKRGTVNGIVHDSSGTGLTIYVEPMSVIEPTNNIRIKETEIEREIERIISELCGKCREHIEEIEETFLTLSDIDVILAKARLSLKYKGVRPEVSDNFLIDLTDSSHPLLLLQGSPKVISNSVTLGDGARSLVITGPNTGGKTVLLKQLGLMALMMRAGLLLPVKLGSSMPVFKKVWADIGDEQSLEQSLSTFSSHMQSIVEIVRNAGKGMLILLDEIGVGTDPKEGAAIARAVLEHLNNSGAVTVSTTHLGELKTLAYSEEGFVNGSLEFDEVSLAPTYKLRLGMAGSSKAITIAARLGLEGNVIERARSLIVGKEEEVSETINELEQRLLQVARKEEELAQKESEMEKKESDLSDQWKEREARLKETHARLAGRMEGEFDEAANQIKATIKDLQSQPSLAKAQKAKEELGRLRDELGWLDPTEPPSKHVFKEGDRVRVLSLNQQGVIESIPDTAAEEAQLPLTVRCGNMRIKVAQQDLAPIKESVGGGSPSGGRRGGHQRRGSAPGSNRSFEETNRLNEFIRTSNNTLDLRGQRVDAGLDSLDSFLDACSMSGTSPVMIIHGHGTGAMKSAVRDYLKDSRYPQSYRSGEMHEGGDGVTVVMLK